MRSRIADRLLIALAIIALPAVTASLFRAYSIGWQPVMALHVAAAAVIGSAAIFRRRLPYRVRGIVVIAVTFSLGLGGFLNFALSGSGQSFMVISVVFAAIFFGARTSILVLLVTCIAIVSIGIAYTSQAITVPVDLNDYSMQVRSWLTVLLGVTLLSGAAIAAIVGINKVLTRSVSTLKSYSETLADNVAKQTRDLEDSRRRFQAFAAASTDRFWETDAQHRLTFVSESGVEDLSLRSSWILGKTRWMIAKIDLADHDHWRNHRADLDAHRPFRDFVYSVRTSEGIIKHYSVSGVPDFDDAGIFRGYRGTSADVTEHVALNRLKNEFTATISHELRTPLTSIRGALGLIANGSAGEIPPETKKLIEIAEQNSVRLTNLVNDLLDIEKLELGKTDYRFKKVDLSAAAEKAITTNCHYGEEHGVTFFLSAAPSEAHVKADPDRLEQVFANLLSNAAKFSPHGERVDIRVEDRTDTWCVSMRDRGPGIPKRHRQRIFDRFTQVDASDSRSKNGTGLGLSITRKIILDHGGTIDFLSRSGEGTTFFFEFPKFAGA